MMRDQGFFLLEEVREHEVTTWPGEVARKTCDAGFKLSSSLAQTGERNVGRAALVEAQEQTSGSGATPSEERNSKVLDDNQCIFQQ